MPSWPATLYLLTLAALALPPAQALAGLDWSRKLSMEEVCGSCRAERFTQCGAFLEGPAFDRAGNLWMTSVRNGDIHKVTPDGRCATVANTGGSPRGLKFHKDGRLFGTDGDYQEFRVRRAD